MPKSMLGLNEKFLLTVTIAMLIYVLGQTNNAGKASILVWYGIDYMIFSKTIVNPLYLSVYLGLTAIQYAFSQSNRQHELCTLLFASMGTQLYARFWYGRYRAWIYWRYLN